MLTESTQHGVLQVDGSVRTPAGEKPVLLLARIESAHRTDTAASRNAHKRVNATLQRGQEHNPQTSAW